MSHEPNMHGYRGIRYDVRKQESDEWVWTYYPKLGEGNVTAGRVKGTRETAIAACKATIDERLGPISSDDRD
jgi:hypothetical protein